MEITKTDKQPAKKETKDSFTAASLQIRADAFSALIVSMLSEPFMSSTIKSILVLGTLRRLEEKYSEEEMTAFRNGLAEVVNRFTTKNDFMG